MRFTCFIAACICLVVYPCDAAEDELQANRVIQAYCLHHKIPAISNSQIRLCIQPMGIVTNYLVFDLRATSSSLTIYPGTHDKNPQSIKILSENERKTIVSALKDRRFSEIPATTSKTGMDGYYLLIEYKIDGMYGYKYAWQPEDIYMLMLKDYLLGFKNR